MSPDGTRVAYIVHATLTVAPSMAHRQRRSSRGQASAPRRFLVERFEAVGIHRRSCPTKFRPRSFGLRRRRRLSDQTAELKGNAIRQFSPDGSKIALLFIEGMPRVAGPLQPMTPLAGVIGDKIYEQRLATIDLGTNSLTQVTPADMYVYEYDWTPDGQGWVATAAHGSGDATGTSPASTASIPARERCTRSTLRSCRSPDHMFLPTARTLLSSKD